MEEQKQAVLRTDHLKAFYILEMQGNQKVVKAVNDVDIRIYENEIYGIAGESGCGKTTLLKTLFIDVVPPLRGITDRHEHRFVGRVHVASDVECERHPDHRPVQRTGAPPPAGHDS